MSLLNKYSVEVYLIPVNVDVKKDNCEFLLVQRDNVLELPSAFLCPGKKTEDIAWDLSSAYLGVDDKWAKILPLGIIDVVSDEECVRCAYMIYLPGKTRIREASSEWITYAKLRQHKNLSENAKKLINEAIWRPV